MKKETDIKDDMTDIKAIVDSAIGLLLRASSRASIERSIGLYRAMQELCSASTCIARELKWQKQEEEWEKEEEEEESKTEVIDSDEKLKAWADTVLAKYDEGETK